jgi:hypothetical protein
VPHRILNETFEAVIMYFYTVYIFNEEEGTEKLLKVATDALKEPV